MNCYEHHIKPKARSGHEAGKKPNKKEGGGENCGGFSFIQAVQRDRAGKGWEGREP